MNVNEEALYLDKRLVSLVLEKWKYAEDKLFLLLERCVFQVSSFSK